jgi:hypothetical protein
MPRRFTKCPPQRCLCCGRLIPRSGFGYSSHMKAHVRRGEAVESYDERYRCHDYRPAKGMARWEREPAEASC